MVFQTLSNELLAMIISEVIDSDFDASPHLGLNLDMESKSVSYLVLISPLTRTSRKLREATLWYILHRQTARCLRLWPTSGSLWSKKPEWYRNCRRMADVAFPGIALWRKVRLEISLPWTNHEGDLDALRTFLGHMHRLKHLSMDITLTPEDKPPGTSAKTIPWGEVLQQIDKMNLESLKLRLICCISQKGQSSWAIPIENIAQYTLPRFQHRITGEGCSFRFEIGRGIAREVVDLFKCHIAHTYALFGRTLAL